jgi:peptide/nickel transport system substrate-binding protein
VKFWDESLSQPPYDPEKAKQLLAESGWDTSRTLTLSISAGNTTREKVAASIIQDLSDVGIKVEIEIADWAALMTRAQNKDYELAIFNQPDNPLNNIAILRVYASQTGWTGYTNPQIDEIVNTINNSVDDAVLQRAYRDYWQEITTHLPVIGLFAELPLEVVSDRVVYGDIKQSGTFLDVEKWDVLPE